MKNKTIFIVLFLGLSHHLIGQTTKPITFSQLNDLREKLVSCYEKKDLISANLLFKPYGYTKVKLNFDGLIYSNRISKIEFSYQENYITISSISKTFMKNYDIDWADLNEDYVFVDSMSTGEDTYFTNSTLQYAVATYATVPISDSDKSWIVNKIIKKEYYNIQKNSTSKHTELCYIKRINQNTLEVKSGNHLTDIKIKKGDKLNYKATGRITLGPFVGSAGPNGLEGLEDYSYIKSFKHGCLMIGFGNSEFYEGGESGSFTADIDGYLEFQINDEDYENNSGSFIVEYAINKPLVSSNNSNTQQNSSVNNTQLTNTKTSFKPIIILEDNFANNKNNWSSSTKRQLISIEGNRLIYTNDETKDKISSIVEQPVSIRNNDDYIIEASIQSLTPCTNDKLGAWGSLLLSPKQSYYGFAIGDNKNDIFFSVGNTVKEKKVRDEYQYTCIPSYFIKSTIAGSSNFLQDWTKSTLVSDGGNVNILKLEKKGEQFNFYVNNRLVTTKNAYALGNNNTVRIVSSSFSKISLNSIKVTLTHSVENNIPTNVSQPNKAITVNENNSITNEKIVKTPLNNTPNYNKVKPITIKTYKGTITNTTLNLKGKCEMTFGKNADGSFQLYGETDHKKLAGKWDLKGRLVESNIYLFSGEILFGYPGTDFPLGTTAPFKITVSINEKVMNGNYIIQSDNKNIGTQEGIFMLK